VSTIAFALALSVISMVQGIDSQEDLQYFSWWAYFLVAAAYSAFVFSGELSKDGPVIFSKENARSVPQVAVAHGAFLIVLLCFLRLTSYIVPALPNWMTDTFNAGRRGRISIADILFVVASSIMVLIERKQLYVQCENDSADPRDPPKSPTIE
jgi:hypothetical protein